MHDWISKANALHANSIVIDTHADTPQRFVDENWRFTDTRLRGGQLSLATAQRGGLHAEFFAAWVEPKEWAGRFAERTRSLIQSVHNEVAWSQQTMHLCTTADQIVDAKSKGQFATLIGIEGGHSIEARLDFLEEFYLSGARYMTLTWSNNNEWADSSGDQERHGGLTAFGREVVHKMNHLGMMVDISHVSDKTFWDVIRTSKAPIFASHSSCRSLTASARNLTDDMMRAIANNGGLVCINFFPAFIDEDWRVRWAQLRPERNARQEEVAAAYREREEPVPFSVSTAVDHEFLEHMPRASFQALIDHFEYAIQLVGIEHVGIGTDFDGIPVPPDKINSAADLPVVTAALLERGHTPEDLKKVLGENMLRLFRSVENAAK